MERWLREAGFPLEMRVAASFRRSRAHVVQSSYYHEASSGKLREVDVVAWSQRTAWGPDVGADLDLVVVMECKASRKAPWVALVGETPAALRSDRGLLDVLVNNRYYGAESQWVMYPSDFAFLSTPRRTAYSVTQAHSTGAKDNREGDLPYLAVRQVGQATEGLRRESSAPRGGRPTLRLWLPCVVTAAPLFECWLDDSGNPQTEEVARSLLFTRLSADQDLVPVWLLQAGHVESFAEEVAAAVANVTWRPILGPGKDGGAIPWAD